MILLLFTATILYSILIICLFIGFYRVVPFNEISNNDMQEFSIIIPFRNEANVLPALLNSLNDLNYPKSHFEVLLIDDHSTDGSFEIINEYRATHPDIHIIATSSKRFSKSPKKDAITTAMTYANFDWVITTDADCIVPQQWLNSINSYIQKQSLKMIVAPVAYDSKPSFLNGFQTLDFLSLQAATVGGFGLKTPFLCNGANLIYKKSLFQELDGFNGNTHIASGDDIFFMEKAIKAYPNQVVYLKSNDAIVKTKPVSNLRQLIHQRMRWAAKTSSHDNTFSKGVGFSVFFINATLITSCIFTLTGNLNWIYLLIAFFTKFIIDFLFISASTLFFKQTSFLKYYPVSAFLYPLFSVLIVISTTFFNYKWKGRRFKK